MYSNVNYDSHLKWRNTWFRLENKIEKQVILVQTKTKRVVRKGPLLGTNQNETCSKEGSTSGAGSIQRHSLPTTAGHNSCHTLEWVMSHTLVCYETYMNTSWRTHECVMEHAWMCYGTLVNASCHSQASDMYAIWFIHMCDMTRSSVWHDSCICATWLIHICDMTHLYVWHDSFMFVTWLLGMGSTRETYVLHDSFINVTCLIHTWDICVEWLIHTCDTKTCVRGQSTRVRASSSDIYAIWLIHMRDMTHSYVWHDSFICLTWLVHMCDMTHSYAWRDSFVRVTWLIHMCDMILRHGQHARDICMLLDSFIRVTWLRPVCDMTHSKDDMTQTYIWHASFIRVTWHIHTGDMPRLIEAWAALSRQMCDMAMRHVTYFIKESFHTYEWVVSHMNASCHTFV